MWAWIKTQLSDMWTELVDWIANHKWYIAAALLIAIIAAVLWYKDYSLRREISSLKSEYAQSVKKAKELEVETERLKGELAAKAEKVIERQAANDKTIKEVAKNAYTKAITLPDDSLLDAYNELISGARERNAERERADTSDE